MPRRSTSSASGPPKANGADHDQGVATKVLDTAVNFGPAEANRIPQRSVNEVAEAGLDVDGAVGPKTLRAVGAADPARLLETLRTTQATFYSDLVDRCPKFGKYLKGWLGRAAS